MPALRQRAAVDRLGKGLPTTRASMSAANGCLRWTNCSISTDAKTSGSGCEGSCRAHDFRAEDLRASAYRRTKSSLPLWQTEATTDGPYQHRRCHAFIPDVAIVHESLLSIAGRTIRCRPSRKRRDAGEVSVNFVVAVPVFAIHHSSRLRLRRDWWRDRVRDRRSRVRWVLRRNGIFVVAVLVVAVPAPAVPAAAGSGSAAVAARVRAASSH